MIKLDILSDPICPWCYIGKSQLDQALKTNTDMVFEIEWHPFQLNPEMPSEGMDRRAYLEGKFGGKQGALSAYAPILERAEALGLDIDFAAIKRTPNTLNAHRLIHWAGLEQQQTAVVSALFDGYFSKGRDIGDVKVLQDIAANCGMDADLVARLLRSDADASDIKTRDANSRQKGVTGVPTFIVANKHVLPGAQPTELWLKILADLADQSKGDTE